MSTVLILRYDKKKKQLTKEGSKWSQPLRALIEVPITLDDFVTRGKVGFEALHEKLAMLAEMYTFAVQPVIHCIATASVVRKVYLERECGLPTFVAMQILTLLRDAGACVGSGSLRKTASYVMFLRNIIKNQEKTVPSISSGRAVSRYAIPDDVEDMLIETLIEELRVAEEANAKPAQVKRLRELLHAKQAEGRAIARKGKPKSDMDVIHDAIQDAEYDDLPSTHHKKRK